MCRSELFYAAKTGNIEKVKTLLAVSGIDVNDEYQSQLSICDSHMAGFNFLDYEVEREMEYEHPLTEAAKNGHSECVRLLLSAPGIKVNHGEPLCLAAKNGHAECVKLLLAAPGIAVNREFHPTVWCLPDLTFSGYSVQYDRTYSYPLSLAAKNGHVECVKLLLAVPGIDVNLGSPLELAAENGHAECVKLLLAALGIDVNREFHPTVRCLPDLPSLDDYEQYGRTYFDPLSLAAKNGHVECVKLLLAVPGIDVNLGSPLKLAAKNGHEECVKLLKAAGAQE